MKNKTNNKKFDYKSSGVDVSRGYKAVSQMKEHVARTYIPGVLGALGGFAGMFELPAGYENPVLVSGTDGVGTKLRIAFEAGIYDTIGIDCVAMCVNDVICTGARPLFFLDYISTGVIDPDQVANIVKGVSDGCVESGCALIGGETAEMPGFYDRNEYDIAGFCVGIVEKNKIIDGHNIATGNTLIGIASSGLHSNGYSLVRKLCFDVAKIDFDEYKEELLEPTKIYAKLVLDLIDHFDINGIVHITGGGWEENIPRMFSSEFKAVVNTKSHDVPAIFNKLQEWGNLEDFDMYSTFNMGIGMVLAVPNSKAEEILSHINKTDKAYIIGEVCKRNDGEYKIEFN